LNRNKLSGVQSLSLGQRILAFLRSDSDGGALIEAAVSLPVFLIIVTGTVATVMALQAYQQLAFACFTASEAIGSGRGYQADPCALAYANVINSLPTWTTNNFTLNLWITYNNGSGSTSVYTPGQFNYSDASCTGVYTSSGNGNYALYNGLHEPVVLEVDYAYTWFPIYSNSIATGTLKVREASIVQ
jgi:Flp pilus assembly protein TadG